MRMTEMLTVSPPSPPDPAPGFRYSSVVHFDELDPMGLLHNSRYGVHVERATGAFFESQGFRWEAALADNPDKFHVVRRFEIDLERPCTGIGPLYVDLWLAHFGRTSCSYGFCCRGTQDEVYAHGARTVVKLHPESLRPAEWTARWRSAHLSGLGPVRARPER